MRRIDGVSGCPDNCLCSRDIKITYKVGIYIYISLSVVNLYQFYTCHLIYIYVDVYIFSF